MTHGDKASEIPRAYGWLRPPKGPAQRVTILFDTGASHSFVHPRVVRAMGLQPNPNEGPTHLRVADDRVIECDGGVSNIQLVTGPYQERLVLCVADIGADDVILGNPSLSKHEGGHGPEGEGTWRMVVEGKTFKIPLMTGSGDRAKKVTTIQGTKKTQKIMRKHKNHIWRGQIYRMPTRRSKKDGRQIDVSRQQSQVT